MRIHGAVRAAAVTTAVAATLGLAAQPAYAADWVATESTWDSSQDRGGIDAEARIHWSSKPRTKVAVASFEAYGDSFYVTNSTGKTINVALRGDESDVGGGGYDKSFKLASGEKFSDTKVGLEEGTDVSVKVYFNGSSCGEHDNECAWEQDGVA